jgi:peptidyl-prolyl cis-trans isomerase D
MFDAVRNNKKVVQGFLALITLPFAFWGVESYVRNAGDGNDLAKVGETKISRQQFDNALREQQDRMRQSMGASFDPKMMETPEVRQAVLNGLIDQRLLMLETFNKHLIVSDEGLRQAIASIPALQEDGKFSMKRYEQVLAAQGLNQQNFEAQMRQDLALQQLIGGIGDTSIVSRSIADRLIQMQTQSREVLELRIGAEMQMPQVKLAADAAQKYYDANPKRFEVPEQLKAEYVTLSMDAISAQTTVSDAEVTAWYDSHKDRFQQTEERQASHILITVDSSASEADKAKAKEKAESVLKEVKAAGANFAALAKKYSQDPGSASKGGDLGFFGRGMMVKPFEDAAFGLKEGEISGLVQSDFGFHIIKLTSVHAASVKPMASVRADIEAELKRQTASRKFAEAAEAFTNMVYEQSDSLKPAAEKFKLTVQSSDWVKRKAVNPQDKAAKPFDNDKLRNAVFGEEAVKNKRNTETVEIAPNTLVAARVLEHKPASQVPFDKVKAEIEMFLRVQEAQAMAKKAGEARLAELQKDANTKVAWSPAKTVSRVDPRQVHPAAADAILKASVQKLPAFVGVEIPLSQKDGFIQGGGYAIYKITATGEAKLEPTVREAMQQRLQGMQSPMDISSYMAALRQRYKVEINKAQLEVKTDK